MERRTEKQESTKPAAPDNNQSCRSNRDKARSGVAPLENLQEEERRGARRGKFLAGRINCATLRIFSALRSSCRRQLQFVPLNDF
jgi:hypothetical protein